MRGRRQASSSKFTNAEAPGPPTAPSTPPKSPSRPQGLSRAVSVREKLSGTPSPPRRPNSQSPRRQLRTAKAGEGSLDDESGVRVCVRVRPMTAAEESKDLARVIRCVNPKQLELTVPVAGAAEGRSYQFDLCAHEGFSQEDMFSACGLVPLLDAAVDGYACTAFCFGPTGTGKTYTMSGLNETAAGDKRRRREERKLEASDGLVPRSMHYLFERLQAAGAEARYTLRASYSEIYNEHVYDLLNLQKEPLQVRYNVKTGFFVQGLLEAAVTSLEDALDVVDEGNSNRHRASHLLNADSSRSHSLLTVHVVSERVDPDDSHIVKRSGKVVFVDLAGSERIKKTGVNGMGASEAGMINKSLMTLGKVISALSSQHIKAATAAGNAAIGSSTHGGGASNFASPVSSMGGSVHAGGGGGGGGDETWVPYRESNLTKLLMESLGGNGLTLMIACVAPTQTCAEEAAAALNYAARARNIQNKPIVQVDPRERLISNLRHEVNLLQMENELLRTSLPSAGAVAPPLGAAAARGGKAGAINTPAKASGVGSKVNGKASPPGTPNGARGNAGKGAAAAAAAAGAGSAASAANGQAAGGSADASAANSASSAAAMVPREMGQLLARYDEELDRLRREAAGALNGSLAAERLYKSAVSENEALGRRLEKLEQAAAAAAANAGGNGAAASSVAVSTPPEPRHSDVEAENRALRMLIRRLQQEETTTVAAGGSAAAAQHSSGAGSSGSGGGGSSGANAHPSPARNRRYSVAITGDEDEHDKAASMAVTHAGGAAGGSGRNDSDASGPTDSPAVSQELAYLRHANEVLQKQLDRVGRPPASAKSVAAAAAAAELPHVHAATTAATTAAAPSSSASSAAAAAAATRRKSSIPDVHARKEAPPALALGSGAAKADSSSVLSLFDDERPIKAAAIMRPPELTEGGKRAAASVSVPGSSHAEEEDENTAVAAAVAEPAAEAAAAAAAAAPAAKPWKRKSQKKPVAQAMGETLKSPEAEEELSAEAGGAPAEPAGAAKSPAATEPWKRSSSQKPGVNAAEPHDDSAAALDSAQATPSASVDSDEGLEEPAFTAPKAARKGGGTGVKLWQKSKAQRSQDESAAAAADEDDVVVVVAKPRAKAAAAAAAAAGSKAREGFTSEAEANEAPQQLPADEESDARWD